ncbi:MAG: hypothetical protein RLZZ196_2071 [Bacteroidota bacterium]|jgi:hypothetical protein
MQLAVKLQIIQLIIQIIVGIGLLIQGYILIKRGR